MLLEHIGLSTNGSNRALSIVSNINTFVYIKRNALSFLDDVNFDWWNIAAWAEDHPSVNSISDSAVFFLESFFSSDK